MSESKVHGNTKKAADMSLAKKEISPQSHMAIMEGRLTLAEAKALGRDRGPNTTQASGGPGSATGRATGERPQDGADIPPQSVSRISKDDTLSPYLCGCGELVARRFKPGHDMRMVSLAKAHIRGEAQPSEEQLAYLKESGKLERARQQLEKEETRRREKTEGQRNREGEAEAERKKRNAK